MSRLVFPDRWLWPAVLLLAVVLAVFETTELDLRLQDIFYDFDARRWQVDRDDPLGRAWFYNGPKYVIYALALGTIAVLAGPARWRERAGMVRRDLALAVGALVDLGSSVPVVPVRAGTVNLMTQVLGLETPGKAADAVLQGRVRTIDVGETNQGVFFMNASTGMRSKRS